MLKNLLGWALTVFHINRRLEATDRKLRDVLKFQHRLFDTIVEDRRAAPSPEQNSKFINQLTDLNRDFVQATLDRELESGNPLTSAETNRLMGYWQRVQARLPLSLPEAQDFQQLSQRMRDDREKKGETDWGAVVLAGIAILVLAALLKDK